MVLNNYKILYIPAAEFIFHLGVLLISFISFLIFSPLYHPEFNSDQAIHVLMSARNDYPQGIYYWGQNRLGSFLPEVTSVFVSAFKIHPLTAISMVNHLFLLTVFYLLQTTLKSIFLKITLAVVLFFPLYTFNAILLIGHPYCSQLFSGIAGVYLLNWSYLKIMERGSFFSWKIWLSGVSGAYFLGISLWVSESSFLFLVYVLIYFYINHEKRGRFVSVFKEAKLAGTAFIFVLSGIALLWIFKIQQFKNYYPQNELYDQVFLNDGEQVSQQAIWMKEKLLAHLFFEREEYSSGIFTWIMILTVPGIIILTRKIKNAFTFSLLFTMVLGFTALFFSTWNYRSEFEPRYFTVIYPFLMIWVFVKLEQMQNGRNALNVIFSAAIVLILTINNSDFIFQKKPGVTERFSGFADLEPGGMIGNYWQVYRACAIAPFQLKGIAKQGDPLRNEHMVDEVMSEKTIYVIRTDFYPDEGDLPDTLMQYGFTLVKISDKEEEVGSVFFCRYRVLWWRK